MHYFCVFYNGAGPNVIRASLLPGEVILLLIKKDRQIVNLRSASTQQLTTLEIFYLTVTVGGNACRDPFVVARKLTSHVNLGALLIDHLVENIWMRHRSVILRDGSEIPILPVRRTSITRAR